MPTPMTILLVFLGAGCGGVMRLLVGEFAQRALARAVGRGIDSSSPSDGVAGLADGLARTLIAFPLGTFVVNLTGCFVMGLIMNRLAAPGSMARGGSAESPDAYRLLLLVGVLGGYTTFSAFSREVLVLWQHGQPGLASVYIAMSVGACLLAVWLGAWIGG